MPRHGRALRQFLLVIVKKLLEARAPITFHSRNAGFLHSPRIPFIFLELQCPLTALTACVDARVSRVFLHCWQVSGFRIVVCHFTRETNPASPDDSRINSMCHSMCGTAAVHILVDRTGDRELPVIWEVELSSRWRFEIVGSAKIG